MTDAIRPDVTERQLRRYREMTPAEKLAQADALWNLAWDATRAGIRMRHPEYDAEAVDRAARTAMQRATD